VRTLVIATATVLAVSALGAGQAGAGQPSDRAVQSAKPGHHGHHHGHHGHHHNPPPISSTPLGQVGNGACNAGSPAAVVIDTQAAGAPTYVAPSDGVITSFSHQANGVPGQVRAIVFADGPTATTKTVVAKSAKVTVVRNVLNTFAIQLPIKTGQRLGLGYTVNDMACATAAGFAGDVTLVKAPFDPDTTGTFVAGGVLSAPGATFRPNISAVLESDIDGDGFGDITQDGCTQSAKVTVACPETTITKKPKHKSTRNKVKVKIEFTASIAGSTFECRLDGHKKWRKCKSPFKRKLGVGRHSVQVRAISPAGVPDPKPAKARFTIRRGH
jgi:hypothetical protein